MISAQHLIDFASIDRLFHQLGLGLDPAECHGSLCGLLCASDAVTGPDWVNQVLTGHLDLTQKESLSAQGAFKDATNHHSLLVLYKDTVESLDDPEFGFSLLLPDDDEPLGQRVEALSLWCQGFLFGLGMGGIRKNADLPGDTHEVMKDFVEISRLENSGPDDDNEAEAAFAEIVEYVRMAVLLMHEELRVLWATRPENAPLH